MYFNDFPTIDYDCTGDGITEKIQDITTRIAVRKWIREIGPLFSKYDVSDGETPEMVAATVYGNVNNHWVVLIFNQITNTYYGWPLSRRKFDAFVNNKYANPNATHHYEITESSGDQTKKIKVMSTVTGATAVTNIEYEQAIQDNKKQIRLLKPTYLGQFKAEFLELLY